MSRPALVLLVVAAALGLSSCAGGEAGPEEPSPEATAEATEEMQPPVDTVEPGDTSAAEPLSVAADEYTFDGIPTSLPAGTIEVEFENVGTVQHDLVVEELGDEQVIPVTAPGESAQGAVSLEPGEYTFYCSIGDHRARGMEVVVTVE
ncbi:cupredoxin domain-containing protein [Nocardiopsis sp. YSL2]|uniref:cupredoxin domain-containing protein n=1 Tax=Nocardiopsis sp. YSL2 TaxID=2939492 RepID=UPI0026F4180B|nr:cupredoxin domain-containing protein [Nocardiopsis sp. YSL2]